MSIGLSKSKSKAQTKFNVRDTGFSRLDPAGSIELDPRIRGLRDQSLGTLTGGVGDFRQNLLGLRRRLTDNAQGLEQAAVNPILQQGALRQGQIRSDLGRRGLGGSSFLNQSLDASAGDFARREGDARAQSRQQLIQSLLGLDQAGLGALGQQSGLENQIAQQILEQELKSFELGKGQKSTARSGSLSIGVGGGGPSTNTVAGGIR